MLITVNGKSRKVADKTTLVKLLKDLGLDEETVIIELNRDVLPKGAYASVLLSEGDSLEFVRFVGGG